MNERIKLKRVQINDLEELWELAYNGDLEWMKWNGPYFEDPVYSKAEFLTKEGDKYLDHTAFRFITWENEKVGMVSSHWEDGRLQQWLEFGICLYNSAFWGKGIGTTACQLWINELFATHQNIARVGFTTWSGNKGMI